MVAHLMPSVDLAGQTVQYLMAAHLMPSVDLLWWLRQSCGTPRHASSSSASRPNSSTYTTTLSSSKVRAQPTSQKTTRNQQ